MEVLYPISGGTSLPSSFVLREIRQLRKTGVDVRILQLRPLRAPMCLTGFEDLSPSVIRVHCFTPELLLGLVWCLMQRPVHLAVCASMVVRSAFRRTDGFKLAYLLLTSVIAGYGLRRSGIAHVHAHLLHSEAFAAACLAGILDVPFSVTVHTVRVEFPRPAIQFILSRAKFLVADTLQVCGFLLSWGVPPAAIHLIRNGVELDQVPLRRTQVLTGPPILLAVGRLIAKKGFDLLLAACAQLKEQERAFRCVVIGDGEEKARLLAAAEQYGIRDYVEFPGTVAIRDLFGWYARATILVAPSILTSDGETDGLPTVIIEALAAGLPVVASNIAGIPDVIRDRQSGFLVSPGSANELADRISRVLDSLELRTRFAVQGRALIDREFDLSRCVSQLKNLFRDPSGTAADTRVCCGVTN